MRSDRNCTRPGTAPVASGTKSLNLQDRGVFSEKSNLSVDYEPYSEGSNDIVEGASGVPRRPGVAGFRSRELARLKSKADMLNKNLTIKIKNFNFTKSMQL